MFTDSRMVSQPVPTGRQTVEYHPSSHPFGAVRPLSASTLCSLRGNRTRFPSPTGARRTMHPFALSGGRDSALTLVAAWRAVLALPDGRKPGDIIATRYLPTRQYSSADTRLAAVGLATELGVEVNVISIQEEFELAQQVLARMVGEDGEVKPIALENAQARIRGAMMLNWGNCVNGLVLVTSNMSEFAVGYFTTGGDNQGGFAPISGIPKTLVNRLLERAAERWELGSLSAILALPPSAELSADRPA